MRQGFMLEGVHSAEDGKGRFGENVRTPALNGASSGGSPNENACLPTEGEKEAAQSDRLPLDELKAAAKKGDLHAQSELGQWLLAKPASPYDHQHSSIGS